MAGGVSFHAVDGVRGMPVEGVQVELYALRDGQRDKLAENSLHANGLRGHRVVRNEGGKPFRRACQSAERHRRGVDVQAAFQDLLHADGQYLIEGVSHEQRHGDVAETRHEGDDGPGTNAVADGG